ncbi:MAG TPA: putative glycolipid-binding domain-containing protein, partial [Ktedonobacterales bacterium]
KVAYINIPTLSLSPAMQRYTCLEARPEGGRYRYENTASGFTAELTVDAAGLVIDYAELWKRLWPR